MSCATGIEIAALIPVIVALGCGGPAGGSIDSFVPEYAQAVCHRVFGCCAEADRPRGIPGPDENSCASTTAEMLRKNLALSLQYNEVKFDGEAGVRCLAKLRTGACSELFDGAYGSLVACADVFTGPRQLGEACDADFVCASGDCEGQTCVVRPCSGPNQCAVTEYCSSKVCVPRVAIGDACIFDGACPVGAICSQGKCAPRRQIGESCATPKECTESCSSTAPGPSMGVCRAGRCQGG